MLLPCVLSVELPLFNCLTIQSLPKRPFLSPTLFHALCQLHQNSSHLPPCMVSFTPTNYFYNTPIGFLLHPRDHLTQQLIVEGAKREMGVGSAVNGLEVYFELCLVGLACGRRLLVRPSLLCLLYVFLDILQSNNSYIGRGPVLSNMAS